MAKGIENLTLLVVAYGWMPSLGMASATTLQEQGTVVQDEGVAQPESAPSTPERLQDEVDDEGDDLSLDIDERFETEGYVGGYLALLQQTVPTVGFTGSLFLDDDLRLGIDISFGNSEKIFSSFKTRGAALWGAFEISDTTWTKVGLSYSKIERRTEQEPLSVLTKGEDKSQAKKEMRNDSLGVDFGIGQLWSGSYYSIAIDYVGFTVPLLRLTGEKLPTYSLQFARVSALYNID